MISNKNDSLTFSLVLALALFRPVEWEEIPSVHWSVYTSVHPSICLSPPSPLIGSGTVLEGPQAPLVGPQTPLAASLTPLTGSQTPLADTQTPLHGPLELSSWPSDPSSWPSDPLGEWMDRRTDGWKKRQIKISEISVNTEPHTCRNLSQLSDFGQTNDNRVSQNAIHD